jgi:polyisoprenoid-binding protein YceI
MSDLSIYTGTWTIDSVHSKIGFVARHAVVSKVRGAFDIYEANIVLDGANVPASTISFSAKADSIDTGNEQRDGHLKSADFLDVENYPTVDFKSTAITQTGDATFDLTGDLTIRGTTRPVTVKFEANGVAEAFGTTKAGFEGTATISRKEWGLVWNAPLETGGVLVSDNVNLVIEIEADKVVATADAETASASA